jgi:hypothetical protein
MGRFNAQQTKQLRQISSARAMLSAIALAAVVSLPSAVWGQGNAKRLLSEAPHLIEMVPGRSSVYEAYTQVTIRGTGFMPTGNIVQFGPTHVTDLPSASGNEITFVVPKSLPSRGEIPPPVLPPGEYDVRVTTPAGTSNALIFTLTPGP